MPVCKRCGRQLASAEMRRYLESWACKDKWTCKLTLKGAKK